MPGMVFRATLLAAIKNDLVNFAEKELSYVLAAGEFGSEGRKNMGMTMAEKILANHSGQKRVKSGDLVTCKLDWIVHIDVVFTTGWFKAPKKIFDPSRHVAIMDHVVPAPSIQDADGQVEMRRFVKNFGIRHFFDVGDHGIEHQVLAERGFALPGHLLVCEDSHTCAAGALNCGARGLGAAGMLYATCKGETWFQVGSTIRYELEGELPEYACGKDVFLYIAGKYGEHTNKNAEFNGTGVANLCVADRQCIATMCANLGIEFATFPCDERLTDYLRGRAVESFTPVESDRDADYEDVRAIKLEEMVPYVALPHAIPNNCKPVEELEGLEIQQAYIGSCANGRLEDFAAAANIVKGRKVAREVRFILTPASQEVYKAALKAGYIETLLDAGAVVTSSTCGACYGVHMGLIGAGERCLSSATRNFRGRMGSPDSEVMLAGPATVAASAITGHITDPRKFL